MSYEIINKDWSADTLGVLVYVLSRPDDWKIYPSQLAKKFNCGKHKMTRILKEIRDKGHAVYIKKRDESGQFSTELSEWIFTEEPQPENQTLAEYPEPDYPAPDNQIVVERPAESPAAENQTLDRENSSPEPDYPEVGHPALDNQPLLNIDNKLNTDNKIITYKNLSFENVPDHIVDHVKEFVDHRKNLKKPLTQKALDRFLVAVSQISVELNLTPERVITETIDAGWQSVKSDWLSNRLGVSYANKSTNQSGDRPRSPADRVRAAVAQQERDEQAVGANGGDLRPQVGRVVRDDTLSGMGDSIDGG